MKRFFLFLSCFLLSSLGLLYAQESQKVAVSAYVAENCGVPLNSQMVLQNKLTQLISGCGFSNELNSRFILTAKVDILTEDVTATTPALYAYTLSYNFYIGDGVTGTLFASTNVEAKGAGKSKDKAYMQALKAVSPRDPALRGFIQEGKQKIIEYYRLNGPSIIKRAQTLAQNQQYDEAMWELSLIPEACTDLYNQANDLMVSIYQEQITQEGQSMLAEARSVWAAGQDREAADKAGAILARINPQSPAYKDAQVLSSQIASRVKALDSREWAFKLQQQRDYTDIRKAEVQAARDIAVTWAQNQPKTVYKIYWW